MPAVPQSPSSRLLGAGPDAGATVVWLRGEHDISTDAELSATLASAIELGRDALVLDLSEVEFLSGSTVTVIVRAREFLSRSSRSLTVRSPSASVRRVIEICGLSDLIGPGPDDHRHREGAAHGPSPGVEVLETERANGQSIAVQ